MRFYDRFLRAFARSRVGGFIVRHLFARLDPWLMRMSRGRLNSGIGSTLAANALLLTCIGAKSGEEREVTLLFTRQGPDFVVYASCFGQPRSPAWYHNLVANPGCWVTAGGEERLPCVAREARGDERERLWRQAVGLYAGYADYAEKTDRVIPVMVLRVMGSAQPDRRATG
ncbi:MAG: nitroreductase/quinone reductase family protein [Myxococcota bacterium]